MHALVLIAALLGSAPSPAPAAAPDPLEARKAQAFAVARQFEESLLDDDPQAAVSHASLPFTLEGRRFETSDDLLAEWIRQLHGRRVDLLVLYGVDVLTPAELEQKYGKPPARLASFPRSNRLLYAVANVSGHGVVLALSEGDDGHWSVVGYTD